MKTFIRKHIIEAIQSEQLQVSEIGIEEVATLRANLVSRFSTVGSDSLHWRALGDYKAIQHPESWRWPGEFFGTTAVYLLFNEEDEPSAFKLKDGGQIVRLLDECPGFEFYLTDMGMESLLCHNDHDYLFAAGKAKSWLDSLEPRHRQWVSSIPQSPVDG